MESSFELPDSLLTLNLYQECVVLMVLSFRKWVCFFRQDIDQSSLGAIPVYMQACHDIYIYAPELAEAARETIAEIDRVEAETLEWDWSVGVDFLNPLRRKYAEVPLSPVSLFAVIHNFDERRKDPLSLALAINAQLAVKPLMPRSAYEQLSEELYRLRKTN